MRHIRARVIHDVTARPFCQYAKNIYETEPAIAWSFTIGLAGALLSSRVRHLFTRLAGPALVVISPFSGGDAAKKQH
jgi:hypothetical protein